MSLLRSITTSSFASTWVPPWRECSEGSSSNALKEQERIHAKKKQIRLQFQECNSFSKDSQTENQRLLFHTWDQPAKLDLLKNQLTDYFFGFSFIERAHTCCKHPTRILWLSQKVTRRVFALKKVAHLPNKNWPTLILQLTEVSLLLPLLHSHFQVGGHLNERMNLYAYFLAKGRGNVNDGGK